jgi:hypothetical protein
VRYAPSTMPQARSRFGGWLVAGGALAFVGFCITVVLRSALDGASPAAASAAPSALPVPVPDDSPFGMEATALLGLRAGDPLAGGVVLRLREPIDRQLFVDVAYGQQLATVMISKKGARPHLPPRETERYALYYTADPGVPESTQAPLLDAIEKALRAREATAPATRGM